MFSRIKMLMEDRGPTEAQQLTMVKLVAVVCWADGELVDTELAEVKSALAGFGGIHPSSADQVLRSEKRLGDALRAELRELPPELAHTAMKLAFRIAHADDQIADAELEVIRQIAECVLPDKSWDDVRAWITTQDAFLKATRRLYG